jgi:alpha-L-fucosidase
MKVSALFCLLILSSPVLFSQHHDEDERYVPEQNPIVREKIRQWQDLKFGLLMHWGPYSQWGIVESWSLCPEEYPWCVRTAGSNPDNYVEYVKEYEGLKNTFNPVGFDPAPWAAAARRAGMKYVVFTTKHHDGFCMFDTKYTDYKVTDPVCPFSASPRRNIALEVFNSFRQEGLWAGVYFSKPDWHSPFYWDPKYPPKDRNVNYNPDENPEKWEKFIEFTHNQILELLTDYGKIDILWLDGGQVQKVPVESIEGWYARQVKESPTGYLKGRIVNQDIRMDELVDKARQLQPGLIVVDRAVTGKNQNYLTPENRVPDRMLPYPWESCITSGGGWSYTRDAVYMSGREGVQLLVDIVAKGGNLLLNVAPSPEGDWQQGAYDLLEQYGVWLDVNGEAIYGSKTLAPYKESNICMTRQDSGSAYFLYLAAEDEKSMPAEISVKSHRPARGARVTLLGHNRTLKWRPEGNGFVVSIPESLRSVPPCGYVWTLKVSALHEQ